MEGVESMKKSMALWIRPDGVAEAYDPELDTVIHFRDKEEQEAFEQWLKEEAGERFREWREKRA